MGVASYAARGKRELVLLHCSEATNLLGTVFPTGPSLWPPYVVSAQRKKYGSLARSRIRPLNTYFSHLITTQNKRRNAPRQGNCTPIGNDVRK